MNNSIKIYSVGNFYHAVTDELPPLKSLVKEACGGNIRRIDRLTQLALIGASQCVHGFDISPQTGLFMASIYGSLNNSLSLLREIYQDQQPPSPLVFVNTVSNAACYYLARQFNLQASNVFISQENFGLESCIKLAAIDLGLQRIDAALVGLVGETGMPIKVHRQRFNIPADKDPGESSHWMLIANDMPGKRPIARIVYTKGPITYSTMLARLDPLLAGQTDKSLIFGRKISQSRRAAITDALDAQVIEDNPARNSFHEFAATLNLCEFLAKSRKMSRLLAYLDTDGNDRWSIIVFETL